MKTYMPKPNSIERKWYVVDAKGKTLGRLASQVAGILKGKHKPIYSPHMDTGDFVIVINASEVHLTGKKKEQKVYRHHSGHPGGLKEVSFERMIKEKPHQVVYDAVWGMIPHNKLGRKMITKLKVYGGPEHKHQAQKPEKLEFDY
ncbi:MAG: 50S ribosomal protein L13 [Bacillota bacterium]|nr:50S ribosomal protein L13 [Bacillota bacterium]MDD3297691.1 50S ribosomal protein L13 [Bacillota bacterium]MDD3850414.1 50S ribosomal protein L13 [Bacillota bacterium]MDD4706609.1 50S ribosomal protein L13 [Bacillota bacterium]